jgi:hypothetical protein
MSESHTVGDVRERLIGLGLPGDEETVRAVGLILSDIARIIRPLADVELGESVPAMLSEHSICKRTRSSTDRRSHTL